MRNRILTLVLVIAMLALTACAANTAAPATATAPAATEAPAAVEPAAAPAEPAAPVTEPAAPVQAAPVDVEPCMNFYDAVTAPFSFDFNNDGTEETVSLDVDEPNEKFTLTITCGDQSFPQESECAMEPRCFVGNLDVNDGYYELILTYCEYDGYSITVVYSFAHDKIRRTEIPGDLLDIPGDGTISLNKSIDVFGTFGAAFSVKRTVGEAEDVFEVCSPYTIQYLGDWDDRTLVLKKDGFAGYSASGAEMVYNTGDTLNLIETDAETTAILEDKDGNYVTVNIAKHDDDWMWFVNDVPETDWFEELRYAG